jgi:cytochrome c biogenesis protein CcdA
MIGDLFAPVEQLARIGGVWSYAAAVVLGFLAIWLSPCHLVGLTLASTYLRRHAGGPRQVALGLAAFLVAMLATAALVAAATLALGRLAGDTGAMGATLAIVLISLAGLVLLDVVPVPAVPVASNAGGSTRVGSAIGLGAAFSVATGPCSLAFVAPLLALPIAGVASTPLDMAAAVAMFVVGHAMGAGLAWAIALRGANWLGGHASAGLRWARTTAGFLLVTLAGWMTANAIMTG